MAPHRLPPGFTFCPEPNELTDVYLRCKIAGEDFPDNTGHFIHVADVYSAEPEKLVEPFDEAPGTGKEHDQPDVYYFFSPVRYAGGRKTNARGGPGRKSRTIDGEVGKHWHSELGAKPVKGGSTFGGYEQTFSYMVRNASTGKDVRTGWIMAEYGISPKYGGGDLVLCKIHRSPNSSATTTSSAAVAVSDHIVSSKKRKAADSDHLEDPMASVPPRRTDGHDEQSDLTSVDFIEQNQRIGDEVIFDQDPVAEFKMNFPLSFTGDGLVFEQDPPAEFKMDFPQERVRYGAAGFFDHQPAPPSNFFLENVEQDIWSLDQNVEQDPTAEFKMKFPLSFDPAAQEPECNLQSTNQAAPPSNFFLQNVEQDIWSLDQNGAASFADHQPTDEAAPPSNFFPNMRQDIWSLDQICGLVAPPCAAQLENEAAGAGTITADDNDQMDAILREEPAADHAIYGLSFPARCSDDVMPWPSSPTSLAMFWCQ